MKSLRLLIDRLVRSAVIWFWIFNGLRLASGVLLLPLLLHKLSQPDLGIYYVFVFLTALVPVVDNAFSFNITRFVSYAMAGASRLQRQGIDVSQPAGAPNYPLLWQLLSATRALYRLLAVGVMVVLGTGGTAIISLRISETSVPVQTWIAWAVTLVAAAWEVYSGWWSTFLRGMNQVALGARLSSLAYAIRLFLAGLLLVGGAGLLALPLATLVSGVLQRHWASRHCLNLLAGTQKSTEPIDIGEVLRTLWPNSWRSGLQLLSQYLCMVSLGFICLQSLGLRANAEYGLSLQIMMILQGMSAVWTAVKWPIIGQLRARHDLARLRAVFWPRLWLQKITFALLAAMVLAFGPQLLILIGTDKQLIPVVWLFVMAVNTFLEMQFATWATLISSENRLPSLWPTVASSVVTVLLVWTLISNGVPGFGPFVLGPFVVGSLFNYWFWGCEGARKLDTQWWRFLFLGPRWSASGRN